MADPNHHQPSPVDPAAALAAAIAQAVQEAAEDEQSSGPTRSPSTTTRTSAAPPGATIITLTDATGAAVLVVTIKVDPTTGAFNVNPTIQAVNSSGVTQQVVITGTDGVAHPVAVPNGTTNVTPAQMAANGLTNASQLNGVSVSLA